MVYAMLSIGVLGFIVWSKFKLIFLMAPLLQKLLIFVIIKNFILGLYNKLLYNTFYSSNLYNYIRLAGCLLYYFYEINNRIIKLLSHSLIENIFLKYFKYKMFIVKMYLIILSLLYSLNKNIYNLKKNIWDYKKFIYNYFFHIFFTTSETLRENNFNFNLFRRVYLSFFKKEFTQEDNWLIWFIGFTEGDGAIMVHKQRLIFVITQKDPMVLYEIKNVLGFGVVKDFKGFSRYIVSNNLDCFLLYLIFNGNLVIKARIDQLERWYNNFLILKKLNLFNNFNLIEIPKIIIVTAKPSLLDSWLSGFTDAEGCFSINISNSSKKESCRCRFILDQKNGQDLLIYIKTMLKNGTVNLRNETKNVYRLIVSMNKPTRKDFKIVIDYFQKFLLKTTKRKNFEIWCKVIDLIALKKHTGMININDIRKLRSEMNKYIIDNKSIGSSKYS